MRYLGAIDTEEIELATSRGRAGSLIVIDAIEVELAIKPGLATYPIILGEIIALETDLMARGARKTKEIEAIELELATRPGRPGILDLIVALEFELATRPGRTNLLTFTLALETDIDAGGVGKIVFDRPVSSLRLKVAFDTEAAISTGLISIVNIASELELATRPGSNVFGACTVMLAPEFAEATRPVRNLNLIDAIELELTTILGFARRRKVAVEREVELDPNLGRIGVLTVIKANELLLIP